jgi:hypothetical protein
MNTPRPAQRTPPIREIVTELTQSATGFVTGRIPVNSYYGEKITKLARNWDQYSLGDLKVHFISSVGNLVGGNIAFYLERDPSTLNFPGSITDISQQQGSYVFKANKSSTTVYSGLGGRKFVKAQVQPSAQSYGFLVFIAEVPLADVPAGTKIGYLEFESHPRFFVSSVDDTSVAFDPVQITPFLQTNDDTVYLSCPSFDDRLSASADGGLVASFLNSDPQTPVTLDFGGDTTNMGFPEGSSSDLETISLEDIWGEVKTYVSRDPNVKNVIHAGKNVYKIFRDKASAAVNSGAAVIGEFVANNIGNTVCGDLTDLGDTAVSAFKRGCRSTSKTSSVSVPAGSFRLRARVRASDSVIVFDYLPETPIITQAIALLGGDTHPITFTAGSSLLNTNGYSYISALTTVAGLHPDHQAYIATNPDVTFSVYFYSTTKVTKTLTSYPPKRSNRNIVANAVNDSGTYKIKSDTIPSSHVASGSAPAILRFRSYETTGVTINSKPILEYPFLVAISGGYLSFIDLASLGSTYNFSADPGVVVFSLDSSDA